MVKYDKMTSLFFSENEEKYVNRWMRYSEKILSYSIQDLMTAYNLCNHLITRGELTKIEIATGLYCYVSNSIGSYDENLESIEAAEKLLIKYFKQYKTLKSDFKINYQKSIHAFVKDFKKCVRESDATGAYELLNIVIQNNIISRPDLLKCIRKLCPVGSKPSFVWSRIDDILSNVGISVNYYLRLQLIDDEIKSIFSGERIASNTDNSKTELTPDQNGGSEDDVKDEIDAEAMALFARDKNNSEYFRSLHTNNEQGHDNASFPKLEVDNEEKSNIISEAQRLYDDIINDSSEQINDIETSKSDIRNNYIDTLRGEDRDNPYRVQMAESFNPENLKERINQLRRIIDEPFYGRLRVENENGEVLDNYIGRVAFWHKNMLIVSPWGPVGSAFRRNQQYFTAAGIKYKILNKYTFMIKNNTITDVKDDSPR